jgi:hypothetical protein
VETTDTRLPTAVASINTIETARIGYCTIGGNTSVHGDKTACEAAGGTWATGLPWATAVRQVSITAGNGQSATVQQQFETIYGAGGLRAQYTVKLDVNGYTVGYGLFNEGPNANGFIVRADKFVVGSAGSNVVPFEVVSGITYIKNAVIQDGTITAAKIATLNADKITSGTIGAQTISLNGSSSILRSSGYVAGSAGWQIRGDGVAEFRNATIRGVLNASDITGGTLSVDRISANSISGNKITIGGVDTANLAASAVTKTYAGYGNPTNSIAYGVALEVFSQTVSSNYGALGPVVLGLSVSALNPRFNDRGLYIKCLVVSNDGFYFYQEGACTANTFALAVPMIVVQPANSSTSRTYTFYVEFADGLNSSGSVNRRYSAYALLLQR